MAIGGWRVGRARGHRPYGVWGQFFPSNTVRAPPRGHPNPPDPSPATPPIAQQNSGKPGNMKKYNPDKHHRRSIRIPGHDYSTAGSYFITICVNYRQPLFGEVRQKTMVPNAAGKMVQRIWEELPLHYPGVGIDTFVVMPDHVHGIVVLQKDGGLKLGEVVHRFKSFTTAKYRHGVRAENWQAFEQRLWLRNYYEHLIQDERALQNIRRYILNNPIAYRKSHEKPKIPSIAPSP